MAGHRDAIGQINGLGLVDGQTAGQGQEHLIRLAQQVGRGGTDVCSCDLNNHSQAGGEVGTRRSKKVFPLVILNAHDPSGCTLITRIGIDQTILETNGICTGDGDLLVHPKFGLTGEASGFEGLGRLNLDVDTLNPGCQGAEVLADVTGNPQACGNR